MDSPQFNVVVDGTVLDGFDAGTVLLQLQQQLKLPKPLAQALLAGQTVTVKRDVETAIANAYCTRLVALGVNARIEAAETKAAPALDTPSTANPEPSSPATSRPNSPHYFSAAALARDDAAPSSAFKRAIVRATAAAAGIVLAYLALACACVGFFLFYIVRSTRLLASPVIFSTTIYLISLLLLALLVTLVLRPLLQRRSEGGPATLLSPLQQPALFAFVAQLCDVLGMKQPERIALTTADVNTASLLPGFKNLSRGEYQLTLSLPVLENTTLDKFAAILAADIATKARLPMLRYRKLIDATAAQLGNCIAGRDWLAQRLAALSIASPAKLTPVFNVGKEIIEQTNHYLKKIAGCARLIDAQLQPQLLLEQDRYMALIAGADRFSDLMMFRARLEAAALDANTKNLEECIDGSLVDDLPALIKHYYDGTDESFARALQRRWESETTPRRGEPPIARERIERSAGSAKPGLIGDTTPALSLLPQRDELAQQVTLAAYRESNVHFDADRLLPVEALTYAATQDILQRQQASVYFNNWFKPFRFWSLADYKLISDMPSQEAATQLSVCVSEIRRLTPDRARLLAEYDRLQNQLHEILLAQHVIAAGKKFAFRYISYDGTTLAPILEERQRDLAAVMEKLAQQEAVMGGRITLGLRLSGQDKRDVQTLHDALRLLHDVGARLHKLSLDCFQLEQLLQRQYQLREAVYSLPIKKLETRIDDTSALLIARLNDIPYPLSHLHGSLKSYVEASLAQPAEKHRSPILQRAQRLLDILYRVNEKLSRQAADYGTIAEEAYRIEPIRLISND